MRSPCPGHWARLPGAQRLSGVPTAIRTFRGKPWTLNLGTKGVGQQRALASVDVIVPSPLHARLGPNLRDKCVELIHIAPFPLNQSCPSKSLPYYGVAARIE